MRARVVVLGLAVGGVFACSTRVAPTVSDACEVDDDCPQGTVCDPFSTRCVTGDERPPRAHLAFDIRERAAGEVLFRTELRGCDEEIEASEDGFRQLEVSRQQVSQSFLLFAYATPTPSEFNAPTADEVITAGMELRQASRLGLPPSPLERVVQQSVASDESPSPTRVQWPRYSILDQHRPPPYIVWETFPTIFGPMPVDGMIPDVPYAPMLQMLVPPDTYVPLGTDGSTPVPCQVAADCCEPRGDCDPGVNFCVAATGECTLTGNPEFFAGFSYEPRCNREVVGTVERFDLSNGTVGAPIGEASVRFRYADSDAEDVPRLGVASSGLSPVEACTADTACGDGRFCEPESGRCLLALAGRAADGGATTQMDGGFSTQVYNYCEADPASPLAEPRAYTVTVAPSAGMPSVTYDVELMYGPPGTLSRVPESFCVPSWGDSVSLQLPLQGAPQDLIGQGDGAYTCCDVGCLPAEADDAVPGPPSEPSGCRGPTAAGATPGVRFEAPLLLDSADNLRWLTADCVPLALPDDGDGPWQVGSLRRAANCPTNGDPCVVEGLAPGDEDGARRYSVRIESPTGSVLASRDVDVELTADAQPLPAVFLPPRVLVRGVVDVSESVCNLRDEPGSCASRAAVVLAERLRMPGETTDSVPGPYLHQVATFYDPGQGRAGAFVLPLDPGGVYVMTALPAPGEDGGPAAYQIVDLREGAIVDARRFVLEEGILVTLDLATFDRRTFVAPLDTGSFLGQALMHPGEGRPVDLNQLGECLTPALEGAQGCKIRQLVPPGSNISVSQVGLARFTARRAAAASDCANDAR